MARILLVDDDPDHHRIYGPLLYYNGFDFIEATSGIAAVTAAKEHSPDLILMDWKLTDMSGLLAAEMIRTTPGLEHVPIICVTGMTNVTQELAAKHGCAAVLHKPFAVEKLIGLIRAHLPKAAAP